MFQHRHYVKIAAMMAARPALAATLRTANESMINSLVEMFKRDNPRFDENRFRAACAGTPVNYRDKVRA